MQYPVLFKDGIPVTVLASLCVAVSFCLILAMYCLYPDVMLKFEDRPSGRYVYTAR